MQVMKVFFYGFLYETGLFRLKAALKNIFRITRGMKTETLMQVAAKVPLVPGAKEVFSQLKAQGYKTALVSSGLPTLAVKVIGSEVGADYAFGFEIGVEGDTLTGEIWGDVIERNGKFKVLNQIVTEECLTTNDCAVIADDRNNASIFLKEALKIGYNPDFVLRIKADHVVMGRISKVLTVINGEPKHRVRPSRNDVLRELIHASGIFVPVVAILIGIPIVAASIIIVLGFYGASEYLRTEGKKMPLIYAITRKAASPTELYQLVLAPVYFALGILFTLLVFPSPANYAAIAIFAFGDSAASIFGSTLSRTPLPFNKDKSLEGSLGGFLFAFLAGSIFVSPLIALVGAAIAMFVEYLPLPINDNLLIPLFTGLALTLMLR
jgi:dolichol kinase/phosphoserine phosphatase